MYPTDRLWLQDGSNPEQEEGGARLEPEPEPEPEPCVASSRCSLRCSTIAEHLAGGPPAAAPATVAGAGKGRSQAPSFPVGQDGRSFADTLASAMAEESPPRGKRRSQQRYEHESDEDSPVSEAEAAAAAAAGRAAEAAQWEQAAADAQNFLAEADALLAGAVVHERQREQQHPSGEPREGQRRSGAPFTALWDQLDRVQQDVGAQGKAVGSLVAYLEGRWRLEEDYATRLQGLCAELQLASAASADRGEDECELTRVFGSVFGVVGAAGNASARKHLERSVDLRENAYSGLAESWRAQNEEMSAVAAALGGLRQSQRDVGAAVDGAQGGYVLAQQAAQGAALVPSAATAQALGQAAASKRAYLTAIDRSNELTAGQYAEGGLVEEQLQVMEQLVMRGAVSVCMPAQYLSRLEGAPASAVSGFATACRNACEDDLDEYVARLAVGRPQPTPMLFQPFDQLLISDHQIRVVSLEPLRTWEIDLAARNLLVRTGRSELVVDGAAGTEITRMSRSRCDALIAVGGLPAGEKMPGFESLTRMLAAGKAAPQAPQNLGTANSRGIGQIEVNFVQK